MGSISAHRLFVSRGLLLILLRCVALNESKLRAGAGAVVCLAGARHGHGDNSFCVVGCRTTPWYGAARIAQHPLRSAQCSELVADVTLFRRNKSPKIHQPRTENPRRGFSRFEGSTGLNFSNSAFLRPCQALPSPPQAQVGPHRARPPRPRRSNRMTPCRPFGRTSLPRPPARKHLLVPSSAGRRFVVVL